MTLPAHCCDERPIKRLPDSNYQDGMSWWYISCGSLFLPLAAAVSIHDRPIKGWMAIQIL
jgi:hypothetical protein